MGDVDKARDRRLGRDVAIEVLPEAFARDADRDGTGAARAAVGFPYPPAWRQRFEGAVQTVSALADAGVKLVVGTDWFEPPIKFDGDPNILPAGAPAHFMRWNCCAARVYPRRLS